MEFNFKLPKLAREPKNEEDYNKLMHEALMKRAKENEGCLVYIFINYEAEEGHDILRTLCNSEVVDVDFQETEYAFIADGYAVPKKITVEPEGPLHGTVEFGFRDDGVNHEELMEKVIAEIKKHVKNEVHDN